MINSFFEALDLIDIGCPSLIPIVSRSCLGIVSLPWVDTWICFSVIISAYNMVSTWSVILNLSQNIQVWTLQSIRPSCIYFSTQRFLISLAGSLC